MQLTNISFFKIVILMLVLLVVGNNLNQYLSLELEICRVNGSRSGK